MAEFLQDRKEYLRPFWKCGKMVNETMMFVGDAAGTLLFEPEQILSVRNYGLDILYQEGVDYKIEGRKIIRLSDKIPHWKEDEYYMSSFKDLAIGANKEICERFGEKRFLAFGETDTFTKTQIAISYIHNDVWSGPLPKDCNYKFPHTMYALK